MTTQELARKMADAFETGRRDDGTFIKLADGSDEWMTEVCREAHGEFLPDDHRYSMIQTAVGLAAEADDEDDYRDRVSETEPPIYNAELCEWLSSHGRRAGYVDEAADEYGVAPDAGIYDRIRAGWVAEFAEVADLVWHALDDMAEDES